MHHTHQALKHLFTDTEVYISTGAGSIDWNRSENNGTRHRTRAGKLYSCVNKLYWTCSLKRLAHVFKYHSTSEGCCTTKNLLTFVFPSANTVYINFGFFFLIISLCNTFTSLFLQILKKSRTSRKQLERQVRRVLLLQWTGDYQCTLSYIADPIFMLIIFNFIYFSNGCVEYSLDQQN